MDAKKENLNKFYKSFFNKAKRKGFSYKDIEIAVNIMKEKEEQKTK